MPHAAVKKLTDVTSAEARKYLERRGDDELGAAIDLAVDRARRAGSRDVPDAIDVHHAFFLLRNVRGLAAPSFDAMRVELRARAASGLDVARKVAA